MYHGLKMKSWLKSSILLACFLILISLGVPSVFSQSDEQFAPDEVIVKVKDGVSEEKRVKLHQAQKATVRVRVAKLNIDVVGVEKGKVKDKVSEYAKDPDVEFAEPNYVAHAFELTTDPGIVNNLQWGMYKVKAADATTSAWTTAKSNPSVKIAILDTGIDQNHEDLTGKVADADQQNCTTTSSTVDDLYGHGTHVAGIAAAATNNSTGVAGMGYNASLMNVKVLGDNGSGYYSWIVECLVWTANNGAKVVNMSLGGPAKSLSLEQAVNYVWSKGVVVVAAAGNSGNSSPTYPAYYKNVIAVAATDSNDAKASWSSFGKWVDVAAPGVNIYSTTPNHTNYLNSKYPMTFSLNYGYGSGASMATPHVAGLAALIWSTTLGPDNVSVRRQIEGTADKIAGTGRYWTYGRINALRAVTETGVTQVKKK